MKILEPLSRWMSYVSAVIIVILMLLVVADICCRYFFNNPITGASEIASLIMIIVVFPALAWVALSEKHVRVDLLAEHFPPRVRAILDSLTLLITLGAIAVLTWRSFLESMVVHDVSSLIKLPHAPFYWIMTAGLAIFCLSILIVMIKNIALAGKR